MAQFFLGMTYRDGLGVQKNNIKAYNSRVPTTQRRVAKARWR